MIQTFCKNFVMALSLLAFGALAAGEPIEIAAWGGVGMGQPVTAEYLKEMADCGMTVAGFAKIQDLDLIQAAGLKAYVEDPRIQNYLNHQGDLDLDAVRRDFAALAAETKDHPAVIGYFLIDEPLPPKFARVAELIAELRRVAPGKDIYVNLMPNYCDNIPDYPAYLEEFVTTCHPTALGYDFYGMFENAPLRGGMWKNFSDLRAAALKHKLPMSYCMQTMGLLTYRVPNEAELSFQAYSALAYGVRRLFYFCYTAPMIGNFRGSPIDQLGYRTATYDALRSINRQIRNLAPVLEELTSDQVYVLPVGAEPDGGAPTPESLITGIPDGRLLIGEFTSGKDGKRYVMVVNRDLTRSVNIGYLQWRRRPQQIRFVCPYLADGTTYTFEGENTWLAPGGAMLLQLNP